MDRREQKHHKIKCWPECFEPILNRKKTFEARKDDRDYQVGDLLIIREWDPDQQAFTSRITIREITYKMEGGQFGIDENYCVLGIKTIEEATRYE